MQDDVTPPKLDAKAKHLNEGLGLDVIDYSNMTGESFENYINLVEGKVIDLDDPREVRGGGLDTQKKYVFDVYKVKPKYTRLFPRSKVDTTTVLSGFIKEKDKPVRTTTTFLHMALNLNRQLSSKQATGSTAADPIYDYYLLQKPTK